MIPWGYVSGGDGGVEVSVEALQEAVGLVPREAPTGGGGAPVAVSRLVASGFPLRFEVAGALPDSVDIEARIDSDGDAMTRDPSEPVAEGRGLAAGSEDVRLVLRVPR